MFNWWAKGRGFVGAGVGLSLDRGKSRVSPGVFMNGDWGRSKGLELVLLHDYLMAFCFSIMCVVFTCLCVFLRRKGLMQYCGMWRNLRHVNSLEMWWTIIPMFVLVLMGYPSLVRLYGIGINDASKAMCLKVTGHQWYWSYEYYVDVESLCDVLDKSVVKGWRPVEISLGNRWKGIHDDLAAK